MSGHDMLTALIEIAASLPRGYRDRGGGEDMHAEMFVGFNAGASVWEIEYCALDPKRNFTASGDDLDPLVYEALDRVRRGTQT